MDNTNKNQEETSRHLIDIFYKDISHMLTFMSINIINSSTIKGVESPTQYNKTCFLQVPLP